jgi:hypothetical protein
LGKWPYGTGEEAESFLAGWGEGEGYERGKGKRREGKEGEESLVYGHWHVPFPSKPILFVFMAYYYRKKKRRTEIDRDTSSTSLLPI